MALQAPAILSQSPCSSSGYRCLVAVRLPRSAAPPRQAGRRSASVLARSSLQLLSSKAGAGPGGKGDGTVVLPGGKKKAAEQRLLDAVSDIKGRGKGATEEQLKAVRSAVEELEALGGVQNPVNSPLIEGSWKLLFTTRPGSASPIQRTFVGVDAFSVFQEIALKDTADPRVANIVRFGESIGELKVEAAASAASGERIAFRFDRAAFQLRFWPYRVPYPVPFRLLGDKAKGWLDTSYLSPSGQLRISKGNKGTTFVLQKYLSPQEELLQAIEQRTGVQEAIDKVVALNPTRNPADSPLNIACWRLLWTQQAPTASKIETFSVNKGLNFQVYRGSLGRLDTVVQFLPGVVLRAGASVKPILPSIQDVVIDSAAVCLGPLTIPLGIRGTGNVDVLYLDERFRITRGNKGSVYVQMRDENPPEWL